MPGAILRRQFIDISNQSADVYMDGALVSNWYCAGSNPFHCWRDSDFVPGFLHRWKKFNPNQVSPVSNWNEYYYGIYSLSPDVRPIAPKLTNPKWIGACEAGTNSNLLARPTRLMTCGLHRRPC